MVNIVLSLWGGVVYLREFWLFGWGFVCCLLAVVQVVFFIVFKFLLLCGLGCVLVFLSLGLCIVVGVGDFCLGMLEVLVLFLDSLLICGSGCGCVVFF